MNSKFSEYEDQWWEREALGFNTCNKWRRGRKYLFSLGQRYNKMDFERRIAAERKLRENLKKLNRTTTYEPALEHQKFLERMEWNHKFPNWQNYRELHMHNRIVL